MFVITQEETNKQTKTNTPKKIKQCKYVFLSHQSILVKWQMYLFNCAMTVRPLLGCSVRPDYLCSRRLVPIEITGQVKQVEVQHIKGKGFYENS